MQHLLDLGVTALELMPIAQFPAERNWSYGAAFPANGTEDILEYDRAPAGRVLWHDNATTKSKVASALWSVCWCLV